MLESKSIGPEDEDEEDSFNVSEDMAEGGDGSDELTDFTEEDDENSDGD